MNNDIKTIQERLMNNLERLDNAKTNEELDNEVHRSNAISQLANAYIKSCNLIIRVEESKNNIRINLGNIDGKVINDVINNEK